MSTIIQQATGILAGLCLGGYATAALSWAESQPVVGLGPAQLGILATVCGILAVCGGIWLVMEGGER